jgi:hypothetical protein
MPRAALQAVPEATVLTLEEIGTYLHSLWSRSPLSPRER